MGFLNPWALLGLALAFVGVGSAAYETGHRNGVTAQKVVDQNAVDKINGDLEMQKTLSRKIVADSEAHALADARHDQNVQKEIDQHDQDNRVKTAAVERKYAGLGLQYGLPAAPAGRGTGSADGVPPAAAAASAAGTTLNQLPDDLAARLRQHAADAEDWIDEYRKCYAGSQALSAWLAAHAGPSNGH